MLRAALLGLLIAAAHEEARVLPGRLVDIDGAAVDVAALATGGRLFVVTMRSASCPVCAEQLARLERQRAGLELCGARFVVLSPGPADEIRAARQATSLAAPWVEDVNLALARALGLVGAPGQIVPAILEVDAQGRVVWQQRGRSDRNYGDDALQERLHCEQREA
jgi:peroxiredoxin